MARRALLIGSQTEGLQGVHGDIDVMADVVGQSGFEVRRLIEAAASAAGIRAAYEELIQDCSGDDAALVYYSGHGGRWRNTQPERDPSLPTWLQFIAPTDWGSSGAGFTGLLAEELSVLQTRLTERTRNVTTILDCCHSARMSRGPDVVPRALIARDLPWGDLAARWRAVAGGGQVAPADANPHAVQVVACAPDQSAYELPSPTLGGTHGALTAALVDVLRTPEAAALSWQEVIELIRPAVIDRVASQRPDVLGPNAARRLFTLSEKEMSGALAVAQIDGAVWIEGAALFGLGEGDTYLLRAAGIEAPLAEAVVEAVVADRARLALDPAPTDGLPPGVLAYPLRVALGRRPIVVTPADHPDRTFVVNALRHSTAVRVAENGKAAVLATLSVDDEGVLLRDAGGEPLTATRRPVTDGNLKLIESALVRLARATHVRELESGQGHAALPADVELTYTRIDAGHEVPIETGEHLYAGDAVVVRARNTASHTRYVSVLDIGLTGAIALLTTAEPSGATVVSGEQLVVGEDPAHALPGLRLFWPEGLPQTGGPRPETFTTIVADAPVAGLPALTQSGVKTRSSEAQTSGLGRLIDDLSVGMRDTKAPDRETATTRYRVHRFDFLLHPQPRPGGGPEPAFEIDERPDPSFRLVTPRSAAAPPHQVAVRLADLTVLSNRSLLRAKVRVDTLVVTAAGDGVDPVQAHTFYVDRVRDGDRLPMNNVRIFDGPVDRFLDLAVWVSKADQQEVSLAELLTAELNATEVAGAVATLAALAVAAPPAAVIAASVGAVATLVRTGARLLSAYAGTSIGVYRTSLLPHERYGAGQPSKRHPGEGMLTAQDLALVYEVIDSG